MEDRNITLATASTGSINRGYRSIKSEEQQAEVGSIFSSCTGRSRGLSFTLETNDLEVEIRRLVCYVQGKGVYHFTVELEELGNADSKTYVTYSVHVSHRDRWVYIPISADYRELILQPNSQYNITIRCDAEFYVWRRSSPFVICEHFTLVFPQHNDINGSPVYSFYYKTKACSSYC